MRPFFSFASTLSFAAANSAFLLALAAPAHADQSTLNRRYVEASALGPADADIVRSLLMEHVAETGSPTAEALLGAFDPARFARVATCVRPEALE